MLSKYNYIIDTYGLDLGILSRFKSSPYDQIYELGKTAVEKFGKDPSTFKKTLGKFKARTFKEKIREEAKHLPACSLRFDSWEVREYINCLIAIIQVDLECPGFIQNFPEAIDYLKAVNGSNVNQIIYEFEDIYDKTINIFNRYSGKSDFKYVKTLFEISDKKESRRYNEKEARFDDYISVGFLSFWKSGDEEKIDYLKKHYIYQDTLLPEDYQDLIHYTRVITSGEIDLERGDLRWVDLYFEHFDEILESAYKDIHSMTPLQMKKINLTLT